MLLGSRFHKRQPIKVIIYSNSWSWPKKLSRFINFKGRNFCENDQKTRKKRNLMPAKVSALKVSSISYHNYIYFI